MSDAVILSFFAMIVVLGLVVVRIARALAIEGREIERRHEIATKCDMLMERMREMDEDERRRFFERLRKYGVSVDEAVENLEKWKEVDGG